MGSGDAYWLTTERLALRRFTSDDFDWLAEFYTDADVVRWLGGVKDRAAAAELFEERFLTYYDEHPGLGIWMTVERATERPLGFHLLNNVRGESMIQIGYGLIQSAWGRGYATEMADAVLRYGFGDLALPTIVAMTNLDNLRSQRVLEKIGLRRNGERLLAHPFYAAQGPMAWFERDREDWLAEFV